MKGKKNIRSTKNILFKNGTVYDVLTGKSKKTDILVKNGIVHNIGKINADDNVISIDCNNKIITQGFTDIHSHFRIPGNPDKETLDSGAYAAMSGGYTKVCVMPNTNPVVDSPELIRYIIEESNSLPIKIFPIGAITKSQKGKELAEIGLMVQQGAIAISDDGIPVMNAQVMRYALEYAKMFNVPVINHAEDLNLVNDGVMNEGYMSNYLGLRGNPSISESIMINRDLQIAKYIEGKIHVPHVSSGTSCSIIKEYKKMGIKVSSEVTPHHLYFSDEDLIDYDTNFKVAPPLRSKSDQLSLIQGLKDGTIDCVASDHAPHTVDDKDKDINNASCGMIGLESAFAATHTILKKHKFKTESIIKLFSLNPSKIMNIDINPIKVKNYAELVVIDPSYKWVFTEDNIYSKSKNTPFINEKFTGKIEFVLSGNYFLDNNNILD